MALQGFSCFDVPRAAFEKYQRESWTWKRIETDADDNRYKGGVTGSREIEDGYARIYQGKPGVMFLNLQGW